MSHRLDDNQSAEAMDGVGCLKIQFYDNMKIIIYGYHKKLKNRKVLLNATIEK